ncbi:hypothetical protein MATL_G00186570 [Megalops atlanticus]|uniref:Uncharacterized protein n=1 Tax=Megalops atlanticus TaxID=7932 RepID=A0A9D3PL44_MEGAT|nr:hypothetical protein MATL_G00186570 [Megalops atlanticus]
MSNIIHSRPLSSSSLGLGSSESGARARDWEAESTSSESKSSSSGGRYRPAWRPRREALNIDSIFSRERRRQAGYSPLGSTPLPEDSGTQSDGAVGTGSGSGAGTGRQAPYGGASARTLPPPPLRSLDNQPRLIQRMESGYESSERNSNSPVSLDMPLSESSSASGHRDTGVKKPHSSGPSWRSVPKSKSSSALLQELNTSSWASSHMSLGEGRSELDELQEEVTRRAREQELQRKKEKEREAAMGFNPRPSKFMDLDELQNQGKGDSFERCLAEADSLYEQSLQLEQGDDMAAALSVCNQAVSKLRLTMHEGCANTHSRAVADKKLQRCMRRARGLQQRMQEQEQKHPQGPPSEQPVPVQILLTDTQEEDQEANQDSALRPPSPHHVKPLPSCGNLHPDPLSHPSPQPPHLAGLPWKAGSPGGSSENLPPPPGPGECETRGEGWEPLPRWESAELSDIAQNSGLQARPIHKHNAVSLPTLPLGRWEEPGSDGEEPLPLPPPPHDLTATSEWNSLHGSSSSPQPHVDPRPPLPVEQSLEREYGSAGEQRPQGYPRSPRSSRSPSRQPLPTPPLQDLPPAPSGSHRTAPPPDSRNWSSWSLDGLDSTDTPFYTPPDSHCHPAHSKPGRPSPPAEGARPGPAMPVERWAENVTRYYNSQHAPDLGRESPSAELSELDSLYQASLQAPSIPRALQSANPHTTGKPVMAAARKLLSGMAMPGRSKTPTAEIERSAYRAPGRASPPAYIHKPVSAVAPEPRLGEDESYSAENLRRIARSLSGTVIGGRPEHLAASRSFVSVPRPRGVTRALKRIARAQSRAYTFARKVPRAHVLQMVAYSHMLPVHVF